MSGGKVSGGKVSGGKMSGGKVSHYHIIVIRPISGRNQPAKRCRQSRRLLFLL